MAGRILIRVPQARREARLLLFAPSRRDFATTAHASQDCVLGYQRAPLRGLQISISNPLLSG